MGRGREVERRGERERNVVRDRRKYRESNIEGEFERT